MRDLSRELSPTAAQPAPPVRTPAKRGFASMDAEKQREIARKGGRAAHIKGTAHEFTPEEARLAGRKGGEAVSRDRSHMAQIGREGGQARGLRAALRNQAKANAAEVRPLSVESPKTSVSSSNFGSAETAALSASRGQTDKDYSVSER
jgi:general stress protein YciG